MRGSEMQGKPLEAYRVPWILYRPWQLRGLRGRKNVSTDMEFCPLFLGAFAILRKSTIGLVMSACPAFRVEQLGSHLTDFH
jgi:hypothetical protein